MSNDTRRYGSDISGTIYRSWSVIKKVLGTDTDLDGSGVAEYGTKVLERPNS